ATNSSCLSLPSVITHLYISNSPLFAFLFPPTLLILHFPTNNRHPNFHLQQPIRIFHFKWITIIHSHISQLPSRNRPLSRFFIRWIGSHFSKQPESFIDR